MKEDKLIIKNFEYLNKPFVKVIIDNHEFIFPELVNRPRCYTFDSPEGCLYCGNKTFRYHSKAGEKKYYQCEKCRGINH